MYLANISRLCASNAGDEPRINIMAGTKNHSKTKTTFLNQLTPLGRLGKIVQLKNIQIKLASSVNWNNTPVTFGKL